MKLRLLYILFLLIGISFVSFSFTTITSCQEINSSYSFDTDREIRLGNNISVATILETCLYINQSVSNFKIDCQGNSIINGTGIEFVNGLTYNNINIENCNFNGNYFGIDSPSSSILNNFRMNNSIISENLFSVFILSGNNIVFENITFENSDQAFVLDSVNNIEINNIIFDNFTYTSASRNGFSSQSTNNLSLTNVNFINLKSYYPTSLISLNNVDNSYFSNITIEGVEIGFGQSIIELENNADNNIFTDLNLLNLISTPAFQISYSDFNTIQNSEFESSSLDTIIRLYNTYNTSIINIELSSIGGLNRGIGIFDTGFGPGGGENNFIVNSTINNMQTMISINSLVDQNLIYGNTFANSNFSVSGINNFSFNGIGNRYLNLNSSDLEVGGEYCINPTNCDFFPLLGPLIIARTSLFPLSNLLSIALLISLLTLFFS